jgi:hypothetical protein
MQQTVSQEDVGQEAKRKAFNKAVLDIPPLAAENVIQQRKQR